MNNKIDVKFEFFLHGADYNPEQWMLTPEILDDDIRFMKEAKCNTMAVGIFAWSHIEPDEGKFDFTFLDTVLDKLHENGIRAILATPSGARPRWLSEKYPEVLRVNENRVRNIYGFRHNHCYTSPVYREKVGQVDKELASRYKKHPAVLMWHISNELGGECHCSLCQSAYREWLRKKYNNDLSKLNHEWRTGFWSHNITDWEQIESPSSIGDMVLHGNFLDWKRFVTYQTTDFLKHEINILKSIAPDILCTTNMMGPYQQLNYWEMKDAVDIISWDSYPEWHSNRGNELEAYSIAFAHDMHRSFKNRSFMLMESTPSLANWFKFCKLKRPNMHKLSSLQAVAHGSDTVQYFQWRKGRGGVEKFHGAVIDHDGHGYGRVFEDVSQLGQVLTKIVDIVGTDVSAEVAIIFDFENRWAIENASGFQNEDKKYKRTCINHYKQLWKSGVNVDIVNSTADLSNYHLVVAPMLYSVSQKAIDNIEAYVKNGGTIVATYMTGYVNENDLCYLGGFPANQLKDVFGLVAGEIDTLYPGDSNFVNFGNDIYAAIDYCELIKPTTAKCFGTYKNDFYKGTPAFLKNTYGQGTAYYIAFRDDGAFVDNLYSHLVKELNLKRALPLALPDGVSAHTREDSRYTYIFVENYSDYPVALNIGTGYTDMETNEPVKNVLDIDEFGVKVLKRLK